MKKILFILFIFINTLYGYSECMTDIYFANGIKTEKEDAKYIAEDILKPSIIFDIFNGDMKAFNASINDINVSYNQTQGAIIDILESIGQKLSSTFDGDKTDEEIKKLRDKLKHEMDSSKQSKDLINQSDAYADSIEKGNNVLVVAHSQGNLFAYQTYRLLDNWMKPYFNVISVASPAFVDVKKNTPMVSWDNDFVARLGLYGGLIENDIRSARFLKFNRRKMKYDSKGPYYVYRNELHTKTKDGYDIVESWFDKWDIPVHSFPSFHSSSCEMQTKFRTSSNLLNTNI